MQGRSRQSYQEAADIGGGVCGDPYERWEIGAVGAW